MADPFQVIREIGRGATGAVYEVRVPGDARPMAAKVLEVQTDQARSRFEREFAVMSRFRHSNVATAHSFGVLSRGAPYLLFDLVQGGTLEDVLEAEGPLIEERVRELLTPVASGLAHAHSLGITHRDLKPANILMTRSGTPIVSDFGVAQSLELERMTLTGVVVGTPAYMAPEQQRAIPGAAVGPRSDVYALGVILYEALTGELPYATTDPRAKAPEITPAMGRIVQRCLQEDPGRRYADAGELLRALEVVEGKALGRGWAALGLVALVLLPLLVAGVVWVFAAEPSSDPLPSSPSASLAAASTPSPDPSQSPAAAPQAWSLELSVGDRQRGRFRRVMRSTVGAQNLGWDVEQVVTARDEKTIVLKATIVRGQLVQADGTVVFDSERPELNHPGFEGMGVLIGQHYTVKQDHRTGRVIGVGGGDALIRLLTDQGFASMNWLSNKRLRSYFTALFGVLPEPALPIGEDWESTPPLGGQKVRCSSSLEGPEVVIQAEHAWSVGEDSLWFKGRYRWREGQVVKAEVEFNDNDDLVGKSTNVFSWELLPPKE